MDRKIRVMQITHDLAIGGLQQVVVNLCNSIDRERFDISVMCLRERGEFATDVEAKGIKVFDLPKTDKTDYFAFLKVAKVLKQERIDVIHTHNTQPFVDGTIAALLSGVSSIIHTDHARSFPDKKRYMFAEWLMSHFAYKVVGVSDHTSSNLIKYEKISRKNNAQHPHQGQERKNVIAHMSGIPFHESNGIKLPNIQMTIAMIPTKKLRLSTLKERPTGTPIESKNVRVRPFLIAGYMAHTVMAEAKVARAANRSACPGNFLLIQ